MILKRILQKERKVETSLQVASRGIRTNEEGIKSLKKNELESLKTEMEEEVNEKMKPDIENKITIINRSIKKIKGKTPMTSDLDMGNKRILNLPPPRDQKKVQKITMILLLSNIYMTS